MALPQPRYYPRGSFYLKSESMDSAEVNNNASPFLRTCNAVAAAICTIPCSMAVYGAKAFQEAGHQPALKMRSIGKAFANRNCANPQGKRAALLENLCWGIGILAGGLSAIPCGVVGMVYGLVKGIIQTPKLVIKSYNAGFSRLLCDNIKKLNFSFSKTKFSLYSVNVAMCAAGIVAIITASSVVAVSVALPVVVLPLFLLLGAWNFLSAYRARDGLQSDNTGITTWHQF